MPASNSLNRFNEQAAFQKFWKHKNPALAEKRMNPQRRKCCQEWRVLGLVEIVHSVVFYISDWKEYFASQLNPDSHEELVMQASYQDSGSKRLWSSQALAHHKNSWFLMLGPSHSYKLLFPQRILPGTFLQKC